MLNATEILLALADENMLREDDLLQKKQQLDFARLAEWISTTLTLNNER